MLFSNKQLLQYAIKEKGTSLNFEVTKSGFALYPFFIEEEKRFIRTSIYFHHLTHKRNPTNNHTVIITYDGKDFSIYCGEKYLSGQIEDKTIEAVLPKICKNKNEIELMRKFYGILDKNTICNFNTNLKKENKLCEHVKDLFVNISEELLKQLEDLYNGNIAFKSNSNPDGTPLIELVNKYSFKKHVLLEGDKGSGKTYSLHRYIDNNPWYKVFVGGHEGIESIDLLGYLTQYYDKEAKEAYFIWKDGPLSQAFRKASLGIKTVLFIDELRRIPKRELNILVAALTPDAQNNYILRTGNITNVEDNVAEEETLMCKTENLWCIATTNVGSAYAIDEMDEALSDRFRTFRKDTNKAELEQILLRTCKKLEYNEKIVKILINFFLLMNQAKKDGKINKLVNLRHLIETLLFANNEEDIKNTLKEGYLLWCERDNDGFPIVEQETFINVVIDKAFSL